MNLICLVDRVIKRIGYEWRNYVFAKSVRGIPRGDRPLVAGDIVLANKNVIIGKNCHIYPGVWFWGNGEIKIGNNVDIGMNTVIYATEGAGVEIGDDTQIAGQCYLIDMNHCYKSGGVIRLQPNDAKKIVIGKDVWIGANSTILKGSNIGNGAVIGAKSLVKEDVLPNMVVGGNPLKLIKERE